jgi:large repetitive protein
VLAPRSRGLVYRHDHPRLPPQPERAVADSGSVRNSAGAVAALDGLALVLVNGGGNAEYARTVLSGSLSPGGYLVVEVDPQNGPDGVALVDTADGDLLDALSYEGAISAAVIEGRTYSLVEGTPLPDFVTDSNAVAGSLARLPDG